MLYDPVATRRHSSASSFKRKWKMGQRCTDPRDPGRKVSAAAECPEEMGRLQRASSLGDQFARWTSKGASMGSDRANALTVLVDDVFKSTVHRAVNRSGVERYSIPLFFGTDYDVKLEVRSHATPSLRSRPSHAGITFGRRCQVAFRTTTLPNTKLSPRGNT